MVKKEKTLSNSMILIFGATGDLTRRKLIPALYHLYIKEKVNKKTPIVAVARRRLSKKKFIKTLEIDTFIPNIDRKKLNSFLKHIHYVPLNFKAKEQNEFKESITDIEKKYKCKNKIFYLALPPQLFKPSVDVIKRVGLLNGNGQKKVVFEKPFGQNLISAKKLNKDIMKVFKEKEIYRIDHYLGKELVENIMVFRFANSVFEQIWNNKFIDHVQITLAETIGVEERAEYYDNAGALRDMVQNHTFQILSYVAMEAPFSVNADKIRDEKLRVFKSLQKINSKNVVLGQYGEGMIGTKKVLGYTQEKEIPKNSKTETFAALRVDINNNRWKGVPFYIRTGKRLAKKYAEINLVMKDVTCNLFCNKKKYELPNVITIRIQPDEGLIVHFNAKQPGPTMDLEPVTMDFCHTCLFGLNTPEAYENLLYLIIKGDQSLFNRWDGVEQSWKYINPILDNKKNPKIYKSGSFGPIEADNLIKRDKREWLGPQEAKS